jgi:hypothetical protein
VTVLVTVCVIGAVMLAGAFAIWLYLWAHITG